MTQESLFTEMSQPLQDNRRGCLDCKWRGVEIYQDEGQEDSEILFVSDIPLTKSQKNFVSRTVSNSVCIRLKCRLTSGVRCVSELAKVKPDVRWKCSQFLDETIEGMPNLKVIIALGNQPFNALLYKYGKGQYNVADARGGSWYWREKIRIIPTYHPRAVNEDNKAEFVEDLKRAVDVTPGESPDTGEVIFADSEKFAVILLRRILALEHATSLDVETHNDNRVLTLALSVNNGQDAVVLDESVFSSPKVVDLLRTITKTVPIIGQNFNGYDRRFISGLLGDCPICKYDTMYGSYILNEKRGIHGLDFIASRFGYFGGYDWEMNHFLMSHGLTKGDLDVVPKKLIAKYNGRDVIANHRACKDQGKTFSPDHVRLTKFLTKASELTEYFEAKGVGFDIGKSHELEAMFKERAEKHKRLARLEANKPDLMLTSDLQVRLMLYDDLGLQKIAGWDKLPQKEKRNYLTDSGKKLKPSEITAKHWSVNEATLLTLEQATGHPFIKELLSFRENQNAIDDHVLSFRKLVGDDGRIHVTSFLHGTQTGRIAMRLHSLKHVFECRCEPRCKGECKKPEDIMWALLCAPKGRKQIKSDYSQIEMRIMGEISGDTELIGIYQRGEDFHHETQKTIYRELYTSRDDDVQRRIAKNVNFGTAYGLDPLGLYLFLKGKIRDFSMTLADVEKFHAEFYARFYMLREWQNKQIKFMRRHGFIETWTGRTRTLDPRQGKHAENQAINSVIQSSAHDIVLAAGVEYFDHPDRRGDPIMEHHDALIVEVDDDLVEQEAKLLEQVMLNPPTTKYFGADRVLHIPLKVDLKIGQHMGAMS